MPLIARSEWKVAIDEGLLHIYAAPIKTGQRGNMIMNRFSIVAVCLVAIGLSGSIFAQETQDLRQDQRQHGGGKLRKMDTNNDGSISRDEWKGRPRGFQHLDRNNDGSISREEAMAAGRHQGKQRLKQMDTNNDQQISRDEWKADPELF